MSSGTNGGQSFDPLRFLSLGRRLASNATAEEEWRTSVGRAYYALFLFTRDRPRVQALLQTRRIKKIRKKRGWHAAVIASLREISRSLGDKLDSLRKLRVEADYSLTPSEVKYREWRRNWEDADLIANNVLPGLTRL